ncbi:MAG: type II toxin-antitoxin system VapC family toxin [Dehalococcoidia bacterium]
MNGDPRFVLDASALLAAIRREEGGEIVRRLAMDSAISTVNWSEVLQKSLAYAVTLERAKLFLRALRITIVPFSEEDAETTAALWPDTRQAGLSLADRACIALASRLEAVAVTSDSKWTELNLPIQVRLIRERRSRPSS